MLLTKPANGVIFPPVPGPFTLIIETSTPTASIALADGGGGVTLRTFQSDRHHNSLLFGPLGELLAGVPAEEIRRVLVGSGPGSYSGTRVGMAAAQGVALAAGCPVTALPSLLALAGPGDKGGRLFLGDARRGEFWVARSLGGRLVEEPTLLDAGELAKRVAGALAAGAALVTMEDPARFPLPDTMRAALARETPDAGRLWRVWQNAEEEDRAAWSAVPPQPIYLKPPHITEPRKPWLLPSPGAAAP